MDVENNKYETPKQQMVGEPGSASATAQSTLERGAEAYGQAEQAVSDVYDKTAQAVSETYERAAKMRVFKELVEHHIQDEGSKVFKSAEKALGHDEIQNIMKQFEQEKLKIKKNLK